MADAEFMHLALRLARRGDGLTSPNPMVGAVLVKGGRIIGRGWHRRAGGAHAEIEAIRDARKHRHEVKGSTLHVTLEPCSTQGRTPPCTDAIIAAGIKRVVAGTIDPNPKHAGRGFKILKRAGVEVILHGVKSPSPRPSPPMGERVSAGRVRGRFVSRTDSGSETNWLADECMRLNETFNHWIVRRTPFVTVKAAMTLDGKIATPGGESKWITGAKARAAGMKLRLGADAILVGVNTILADDPELADRRRKAEGRRQKKSTGLRRIILDSMARTPLDAKIVSDEFAALTTIVVSNKAPRKRVQALAKRVSVLIAPLAKSALRAPYSAIDLRWLMKKLGTENVASLLVEGGGEVNASFLSGGLAQRVVFFYAPRILGGRESRKAVAGEGIRHLSAAIQLGDVEWKTIGDDLMMSARVVEG